jgi:hypothetical protein
LIANFFRRVAVMGFGFVLAACAGALFLPLAALADSSIREAGFDAAVRAFYAFLDRSLDDGDPTLGVERVAYVLWAILVAVCVAPLAFAALIGEIAGARNWTWYVGASGVLAAASPWIARGAGGKASARPPDPTELRILALFFLTGALTGLLYWAIAARGERVRDE